MSFIKDFVDCKIVSITAENNAKLNAGKVSSKIIAKVFQYVITVEKSEKIRVKKLLNPD